MSRLSKNPHLISKAATYVSVEVPVDPEVDPNPIFVADERALNANRTPDDVASPTDFAYLTTDGSSDAPYLQA